MTSFQIPKYNGFRMTKFLKVILVFIIVIIFISISSDKPLAEYILKPVPDDNKNVLFSLLGQADKITEDSVLYDIRPTSPAPPISFGRLLISTHSATESSDFSASASAYVLGLLDTNFRENQNRLAEFQNSLIPQVDTSLMLITPTPTINNNLNNIANILISPSPTLHPLIAKLLEEERMRNLMTTPTPNSLFPPETIGDLDQNPKKTYFTIALLGDSMIDTLGKDLPHLHKLLSAAYPEYTFNLLNYGQGSTDLDSGLYRLTNTTRYLDQDFPPLLSQKPDIVVVESFAYNHWTGEFYDLDRQWITIAKIIDTIKLKSPDSKIILAASIAPNTKTFGDGKLNWPAQLKWNSATITKGYLQNIVNFATSEHYPIADAYHPSMQPDGDGDEKYINQGDHIHPSDAGAQLFSEKIVEAIKNNNLIN